MNFNNFCTKHSLSHWQQLSILRYISNLIVALIKYIINSFCTVIVFLYIPCFMNLLLSITVLQSNAAPSTKYINIL